MSNFAQIITSFERAGNFPLEANYIFPTVEELKEFYSDEIQAALLHKGLLKVVESDEDGNQALYWVTKKETNDELEFTKLISGGNISEISESLNDLIEQLEEETTARKNADTALWGTEDPSNIDPDYNSINDLTNQLKALKEDFDKLNDKFDELLESDASALNQLKKVVGTEEDDVAEYMQTLPYVTITALEEALVNVIGDPLPSSQFSSLRGIEDYLINYVTAETARHSQYVEELNNIETGVGLNADGSYSADYETYYLQDATSVMNALKTLDHLIYGLSAENTLEVDNSEGSVELTLTETVDAKILAAVLKLSTEAGNQIIKKNDGVYTYARTEYEDGVLTFKVNDNIISQHNLGVGALVDDSYYDSDTEELVFIFKLTSGDKQTVRVPVGELIREWEPYNKDTSPIVLERTVNIQGVDQLSADINLSPSQGNLLSKEGNTLYASGYTTSMYHDGVQLSKYLEVMVEKEAEDVAKLEEEIASSIAAEYTIVEQTTPDEGYLATYVLTKNNIQVGDKINVPDTEIKLEVGYEKGTLSVILNEEVLCEYYLGLESVVSESHYDADSQKIVTVYNLLNGETQTVETSLTELVEAIYAELDKKAPLESPAFTGTPTIETSPEEDDDSQKIPTTSWVRQCVETEITESWAWEELD